MEGTIFVKQNDFQIHTGGWCHQLPQKIAPKFHHPKNAILPGALEKRTLPMPRKKTKTLNACPLWPEGIRMVEICRVFFWGGRLVKGSVRSVVFWGGENPWCWKKVFSYGNYSRYCFRQGLLKETRLQLEKKEPLPRYVWWFWTYIKKMHPFFIQPWHRGILGTKVMS